MHFLRNRHFLLADLLLLPLAVYLAFVFRLDSFNVTPYWASLAYYLPLTLALLFLVFRSRGLYARYWQFASVGDLMLLLESIGLAWLATSIIIVGVRLFAASALVVPYSVLPISLLTVLAATAGPRLLARVWQQRDKHSTAVAGKATVIIGAGSAGVMILRELSENPQVGLTVVGFVDDAPTKQGIRIHGVPVLGDRKALRRLARTYGIHHAVIAMPTAPGREIRQIRQLCEAAGIEAQIIPGMYELLGGKVRVNQLRTVQIEDLLRREPVRTDVSAVAALLQGRRVLVTGGGGSIGSELCRQILRCGPAELIVLGHGENSVFSIQNELDAIRKAEGLLDSVVSAVIADVRFLDRIKIVFEQMQPEIVFHAAAHKHVPLMELNPAEAVINNVIGTRNVLDASYAVGVERFVMISTDKAVNPTSVMGASKRAAEMLVLQMAGRTGKPYVAVRFGNVLGSRGSVIHTFNAQIARGGPVTVTDPEMRRYFMTIPEAVQLVLQAAELGHGGEIFVLDMGEPVRIVDLARDVIELSGLEVGHDIDIAFSGLRPGEKLYEELFIPGEEYRRTRHEKIFIAANASLLVDASLDGTVHLLKLAAERDDRAGIVLAFRSLIPEYTPIPQGAPKRPALVVQVAGSPAMEMAFELGKGN
ncbi:NAD-dependent epimerase/dehydratase family protein [bacterium]|nr:NAD-dependent epimerase/dehydratase family protein [bacterium]